MISPTHTVGVRRCGSEAVTMTEFGGFGKEGAVVEVADFPVVLSISIAFHHCWLDLKMTTSHLLEQFWKLTLAWIGL